MKLEVGQFIRTKDGIIAKIIDNELSRIGEKTIFVLDREVNVSGLALGDLYLMTNPLTDGKTSKIDTHFGDEKIISKVSYNIIDILEVGDYVNGLPIEKIDKYLSTNERYLNIYGFFSDWENEDIISVITHEQIENIKYKVGE